jgi:DNA-binding GntR family transcriptional regulator
LSNDTAKPTLVERLTRQLSDEIASGLLGPGVRLDEKTLAERFDISRTPVREALGQLVAIGLAARRPHRGVIVAAVGPERLGHMFEVMTELEGTCARFAAERMTAAERVSLARLHAASAAAAASGDAVVYAGHNRDFHQAIYVGSHNAFLVETTQDVRRRLAPFRNAQFQLGGRPSASFAEHAVVVDAIGAADGGAAHAAMVAHIARVRDAYRTLQASWPGAGETAAASLTAPEI